MAWRSTFTTTLTRVSLLSTSILTVFQATLTETTYIRGPTVTKNTPETFTITQSPATE
jgi:hypothetical protein